MAIVLVALIGFFGLSFQVLGVVLASDVFGRGAPAYGLMLTMLGVGAVISAPFVASLGGRVRRSKVQGVALLVYGAALVAAAVAPVFELCLLPLAVLGASHLASASTLNTTIQMQVDEERRAQVLGVYLMVLMLSAPLGQLCLSQLIVAIGPRLTFGLSGTALVCVGVLLGASGGLRRLDAGSGLSEPHVERTASTSATPETS